MSLETLVGAALAGPKKRRSYSQSRGWSTTWEYEGTEDAIMGVVAGLGGAYDLEIDTTSPKSTLTVRTPDAGDAATDPNQIIAVQFELQSNTAQKSGYEHHKSIALGKPTIQQIKKAISDRNDSASFAAGNATTLYGHMVNGQDAFVSPQFVFRMTQYISKRAIVDILFANTSRVYTKAALIAETNPTGFFPVSIEQAHDTVYTDQYGGAIPTGYNLGWLKQAPTVTTIAGEKQAITIEYWLEAWSEYYYGGYLA